MGLVRGFLCFLAIVSLSFQLGCIAGKTTQDPAMPPDVKSGSLVNARGDVVSSSGFLEKVEDARYILLGEGHTNPCDHQVQADVIEILHTGGVDFVMGLEMVDFTRQEVLDRFNKGGMDTEELASALDWDKTWGHPYPLYEPVFSLAKNFSLDLHGLNLPSDIVHTVGRQGLDGLTKEEKALLPETIIPPKQEQQSMLEEQFTIHREMTNRTEEDSKGLERFFLAQSLWDTAMAERIVEVAEQTGKKVVVLVGGGHVEYGWGIEHRLNRLHPEGSVVTVMPWRGVEPVDEAAGDIFFYCPTTHRSRLGFELMVTDQGVKVKDVTPGSKADKAGLQTGDIIQKARGEPVRELLDLHKAAIRAGRAGEPLTFSLLRDGEKKEAVIELSGTGDK